MKTYLILIFIIFSFFINTGIQAQNRVMLNLNYSVNGPTGSFKDYIGNTSFRGWNANITYRINEKIAIGATAGFQDFYEKTDRALYKDSEGRDISAVVSKSLQTIPLLATVRYSLSSSPTVNPYVGVGIGGSLIMHSRYLGEFPTDYNKLTAMIRPEVGVFLPIMKEREAGLTIAGSYNFIPYNENGIKNLNSWGISIGAKFPLR